jgi:glycosyltransferase involved in cell wall biosynthesis
MKILTCHTFYQQHGGEDQVFQDETRLLEMHGHEVIRFVRHNDAIDGMRRWPLALGTIWNRKVCAELRRTIRRERPCLVHFTNIFPLISPGAYYAARAEGVKVVQSLHNYRLICPSAFLLRDGKVCEDCMGRMIAWPAVRHGCYRGDRRATAVVTTMLAAHRTLRTWSRMVDLFVAITEFSRRKFIEGGLPAGKIVVKPNFVYDDSGPGSGSGGFAVFAGRLSPEKGLDTLLAAWSQLKIDLPLTIIGDGPLADRVRRAAAENSRVRWLGHQRLEKVLEIVGAAKFLVLPSVWYEGALPRTVLEAFSKGTPVVASNLGAMTEGIQHGKTGLLFAPGDPDALGHAVNRIMSDPKTLDGMRAAARREFEQKYTAVTNYRLLLQVYSRALGPVMSPTSPAPTPAAVRCSWQSGFNDGAREARRPIPWRERLPRQIEEQHTEPTPAHMSFEQ